MNYNIRWVRRKGHLILQEKIIRIYDDGGQYPDEIEEWVDVPIEDDEVDPPNQGTI